MIESLIKDYQAKLESRLDIILSESGQLYDDVLRACGYAVLNGGKRIRPVLLLEFYKLCGGNDAAYPGTDGQRGERQQQRGQRGTEDQRPPPVFTKTQKTQHGSLTQGVTSLVNHFSLSCFTVPSASAA